jgi:hypothetical protein
MYVGAYSYAITEQNEIKKIAIELKTLLCITRQSSYRHMKTTDIFDIYAIFMST